MKFLQIAELQNKIKELSNLPNEDDINLNEYISNYIFEQSETYNNYSIGDIVFVQKYTYKNGARGNNHMFLIVDIKLQSHNILYFGMLISSKTDKITYKANKFIKKDNKNNLKKDSIVKTDVIYKILTKNILLKIGNIAKTKVDVYKNYLINNN